MGIEESWYDFKKSEKICDLDKKSWNLHIYIAILNTVFYIINIIKHEN